MELMGIGTISAIVVGLVAIVKRLGINSKFAPIFAIMFGLIFTLMGHYVQNITLLNAILGGVIIGLSACGLWAVCKKTIVEGIIKGKIN